MDGPTLDQRFVDTFRLAARQAGAVALHLRGKVKAESKGRTRVFHFASEEKHEEMPTAGASGPE